MKAATAPFLPVNLREAQRLGWESLDIVLISGDAYVDHPSFGAAVIGRVLEREGYKVGIIPQPRIGHPEDFLALGVPRLFFGIAPGNVDSMLIHFTALKRVRNDDPYTPGGGMTRRPKRAAIAYTSAVRNAAPGVPVIIGGIECSTRRLTHYDYWDDSLRRSILLDSKADLLVWGMGERPIIEIARALDSGRPVRSLEDIPGTVHYAQNPPAGAVVLPSFEDCKAMPQAFIRHFRIVEDRFDVPLAESTGGRWVVQNPPHSPMSPEELDAVFALPFARREHPSHADEGGVPALETVRTSIISHRGCLADCSFCSISVHQGRALTSRTEGSVIAEARRIASDPSFKGTISDVGGPSANMYGMDCATGGCASPRCVSEGICPNLKLNSNRYLDLLEAVAAVPGVKHVFVGSGMRYDLLMAAGDKAIERVISRFVGGQLKVAPEHSSERVLHLMRKPPWREYQKFRDKFIKIAARLGLKRHLIPYLITSHPGATIEDEQALLAELERSGFVPDQVQDFIPLPMTRSAAMYYTGIDPDSGQKLFVARARTEKEAHFNVLRAKQAPSQKKRPPRSDGRGRRGSDGRRRT